MSCIIQHFKFNDSFLFKFLLSSPLSRLSLYNIALNTNFPSAIVCREKKEGRNAVGSNRLEFSISSRNEW